MSKLTRQQLILQLIENGNVANQEDLRRALIRHGQRVTQATLSRDIHELGIVKTAEGYAVATEAAADPALDAEGWEEMLGTIAGDDTILIICENKHNAERMANRIREMLA